MEIVKSDFGRHCSESESERETWRAHANNYTISKRERERLAALFWGKEYATQLQHEQLCRNKSSSCQTNEPLNRFFDLNQNRRRKATDLRLRYKRLANTQTRQI